MVDDGKKKAAVIGGICGLLLVAAMVGVTISHSKGSTSSDDDTPATAPAPVSTSVKAIKSICQPTDYQQTCETALTSTAGNTTDPKKLVEAAFTVIVDRIHQAINQSTLLRDLSKDKSTSAALKDCEDLLDYSIEDLRNSLDQLGGIDLAHIDKAVDDLMTWLSAVYTYQETCLDGFDDATSPAAQTMIKALNQSRELTANALAIVEEASDFLGQFDLSGSASKLPSRRLLSEDGVVPSWMSAAGRRLLETPIDQLTPNAVVALDGSGQFKSINDALKLVPLNNRKPFVIHVKAGIYKEKVIVTTKMKNVAMIGDGPDKTVITGTLNNIDGVKTFDSASFAALGDMFIGKNIGFENTAGPEKHQAVALLVQSDKSVFYNCRMDGYQDTLYAHAHRQFYRECTISGTIDFIFGDASSFFQNCLILARKPLDNQRNIVTAQGRKLRRGRGAIILHNCTISAEADYKPFQTKLPTYLGRPWKDFSRTFVMQCQLDDLIHPDGWLPWVGEQYLNTLTYSEFDNRGPGADRSNRVKWKGIITMDYTKAQRFTAETFFKGNVWIPPTGVPYIPGLLPMSEAGRIH